MTENSNGKDGVREVPSTQVEGRAKRRQYTAEYKLRIIREVEACTAFGGVARIEDPSGGKND